MMEAPKTKGCGRRKATSPATGASSASCVDLRHAAEAIATSLCAGIPLLAAEPMALTHMRDALLAENPDESEHAAGRCAKLRVGIASAVRNALTSKPAAAALLVGDFMPRVRVEVRGSAARTLPGTTFTVGRGAECDVQAAGDATVSRLQFIAISLPKGILVVDAWSSSGTRTISRDASVAGSKPCSIEGNRMPFVLAHNERATLKIGMKTTVTLGLSAKAAADARAKAARAEVALAGELTPVSTPPATVPASWALAPTLKDAPSVSVATTIVDAPVVASAEPQRPPLKDSAAAELGRQASASSQAVSVNGARSAAKRAFNVVRASVKLQGVAARRSQLLWRCRAAARNGLLDEDQRQRLEERVRNSEFDFDEVSEILDGLGIPSAPREFQRSGSGTVLGPGTKVRIQNLEACPELNGYTGICAKYLELRGRWAVKLTNGEVKAVRPHNLSSLPEERATGLPEVLGSNFSVVKCVGVGCRETVAVDKDEARRRFQCSCGAPAFCTGCGATPYHYHGHCTDIPKLCDRWHDWLKGRGRIAYRGLRQKAAREAVAQRRALQEASEVVGAPPDPEARRRSLLAARAKFIKGEGVRHFFTRCTLCGSNGRCIVGPRFQCLHCPAFDCCLKCEPQLARGHDSAHVFQILFECEFDWGKAGVELPVGTRARLRQHPVETSGAEVETASAAAPCAGSKRKRRGYGLEGVIRAFKRGKYDVVLDDGPMRHVLPQDLQPLLTQHQAQLLLEGAGGQQ